MEAAVTVEPVPPLVFSSARIIRRAAHDLVCSDEDWPVAAAQVVLAQPMIQTALAGAVEHQLVKVRILDLHQPRVWGISTAEHVAPIPEIKQCVECHKAYPCSTVQAYGVTK